MRPTGVALYTMFAEKSANKQKVMRRKNVDFFITVSRQKVKNWISCDTEPTQVRQ
jgi:hypothetical protein